MPFPQEQLPNETATNNQNANTNTPSGSNRANEAQPSTGARDLHPSLDEPIDLSSRSTATSSSNQNQHQHQNLVQRLESSIDFDNQIHTTNNQGIDSTPRHSRDREEYNIPTTRRIFNRLRTEIGRSSSSQTPQNRESQPRHTHSHTNGSQSQSPYLHQESYQFHDNGTRFDSSSSFHAQPASVHDENRSHLPRRRHRTTHRREREQDNPRSEDGEASILQIAEAAAQRIRQREQEEEQIETARRLRRRAYPPGVRYEQQNQQPLRQRLEEEYEYLDTIRQRSARHSASYVPRQQGTRRQQEDAERNLQREQTIVGAVERETERRIDHLTSEIQGRNRHQIDQRAIERSRFQWFNHERPGPRSRLLAFQGHHQPLGSSAEDARQWESDDERSWLGNSSARQGNSFFGNVMTSNNGGNRMERAPGSEEFDGLMRSARRNRADRERERVDNTINNPLGIAVDSVRYPTIAPEQLPADPEDLPPYQGRDDGLPSYPEDLSQPPAYEEQPTADQSLGQEAEGNSNNDSETATEESSRSQSPRSDEGRADGFMQNCIRSCRRWGARIWDTL